MKHFLLLLSVNILHTTLFAQIDEAILSPCMGYPTEENCCTLSGGMWVTHDSSGFCYLTLTENGNNQTICTATGGESITMPDGSVMCVAKGVKVLSGYIYFVNKMDNTILMSADVNTYKIRTKDLPPMKKSNKIIQLFYVVDPDGNMRATAVKSDE